MKKKITYTVLLSIISICCLVVIAIFEVKQLPVGSTLAGIILGFSLPLLWKRIQDLADTLTWKEQLTKLKRGGFIDKNTQIRISFSYLFRIKAGNKYLLVPNSHNTGKYQPVGGVYQFNDEENDFLKKTFHAVPDNKFSIDQSSVNDYRLYIK